MQTERFLEASVGWESGGTESGGFYRLPFSFLLPPNSLPSLRTEDKDYVAKRVHRELSFGMFVEYTLEGSVHHPMWADHIEYRVVHVIPATSLLGYLPTLRGEEPAHALSLMVNPASPEANPGRPVSGFFQVLNPQGMKLETLTLSLVRRVAYAAQGVPHQMEYPSFDQVVEVPHHESRFAGQFSIPVPVSLDTVPPSTGALFSTEWVFRATLKGGLLSRPLVVEGPLGPPPTLPTPTP